MFYDARKIEYSREPAYFLNLSEEWNLEKFPALWIIGNSELLNLNLAALYCSRKCPGKILRKCHEFAESLRIKDTPVIGGFQTPVEKMCLEVLLKGSQPVVLCPARGIQKMRVEPEWSEPIDSGRLLVVSPFGSKQRRPSKATAEVRNVFVAAAADRIIFLHAAPGSRTIAFAERLLSCGREVLTLDHESNVDLKKLGAGILA